MMRRQACNRGNTLIEVVIATVLVGVVLVASLETLGGATRTHRQSATTAEAWAMAERYAAEIMAEPYADLQSSSSVGVPGHEGWTVEVIVTRCEASPSDSTISGVVSDQGLKHIKVLITNSVGGATEFEMLRSQYGAGAYPSSLGLTHVGGVTASLSITGGAEQLFGDQPLNEAPTP